MREILFRGKRLQVTWAFMDFSCNNPRKNSRRKGKMTEREIAKYDLEYSGVLCTGIKWRYPEPNIFYFTKDGKEYEFTQTEDVDCIADTDHIRCVIEYQFLPWLKDEHIKELESENAALRERLEKAELKGGKKDD